MHALDIHNICKSYGTTNILKEINISIEGGEFLILVGPSGCGKSTLLNLIAGLEEVTSGKITIGDKDVTHLSPAERDIAMVFQSYALYPNMSVRQNIAFGMEIQKKPKDEIEETITRVAKLLQMEDLLDRKPSMLSGGQRQRVALGRALSRDPSIFLFDEPLSNLDAKLRVEMRAEIKQLHQRMKTTIVYVTHDQIEAMTLGDKIAVMKDGIIQQFGSPDEVYTRPNNMFVASFMGSPSMNFIPVTLNDDATTFTLTSESEQKTFPVINPSENLQNYRNKEVILGIRPEHFHNRRNKDTYFINIPSDMQEFTGPDLMTYTTINDQRIICRRNPQENATINDVVELGIKIEKAVFYDKETETLIS